MLCERQGWTLGGKAKRGHTKVPSIALRCNIWRHGFLKYGKVTYVAQN